MRWLLVACLAGCSSASAGSIRVRYPAAAAMAKAATVVIQFTGEVAGAQLTINGALVAAGAHTRCITVEGVPAGEAMVMLAAEGGIEKAFGLTLEPGQRIVVPVSTPAPPPRTTHPAVQALLTLAVYVGYSALTSLW